MRGARRRFQVALVLSVAAANSYTAPRSASDAWSEIMRNRYRAPTAERAPPAAGPNATVDSAWPLAELADFAALLRGVRAAMTTRARATRVELAGVWSRRGALRLAVHAGARRCADLLRAATTAPALTSRVRALRERSGRLAGGARQALCALAARLRVSVPASARRLRAALAEIAAELGVLPALVGGGHLLRGVALIAGLVADRALARLRPPLAGACVFRSAGAFARHFALDDAVLAARRATACAPLKRAARTVLISFHPDKFARNYPGCAADLSVAPMQTFLAEYARAKEALCGR